MGRRILFLLHRWGYRCCRISFSRCLCYCREDKSLGGANQGLHSQVVGFLAVGLNFTTLTINNLIYDTNGEQQAVAAGFILLSMVFVRETFPFSTFSR